MNDLAPHETREPAAASGAGETPVSAATAEPSQTDLIVDRWFGDYAIPNYFGAAKAELKKRLNQLA